MEPILYIDRNNEEIWGVTSSIFIKKKQNTYSTGGIIFYINFKCTDNSYQIDKKLEDLARTLHRYYNEQIKHERINEYYKQDDYICKQENVYKYGTDNWIDMLQMQRNQIKIKEENRTINNFEMSENNNESDNNKKGINIYENDDMEIIYPYRI